MLVGVGRVDQLVSGALDGPLVMLFHEDSADEAGGGGFVRERAEPPPRAA